MLALDTLVVNVLGVIPERDDRVRECLKIDHQQINRVSTLWAGFDRHFGE